MKIKHVLATLTFSMAAGFAAFGLANHQGKVAEETKAEGESVWNIVGVVNGAEGKWNATDPAVVLDSNASYAGYKENLTLKAGDNFKIAKVNSEETGTDWDTALDARNITSGSAQYYIDTEKDHNFYIVSDGVYSIYVDNDLNIKVDFADEQETTYSYVVSYDSNHTNLNAWTPDSFWNVTKPSFGQVNSYSFGGYFIKREFSSVDYNFYGIYKVNDRFLGTHEKFQIFHGSTYSNEMTVGSKQSVYFENKETSTNADVYATIEFLFNFGYARDSYTYKDHVYASSTCAVITAGTASNFLSTYNALLKTTEGSTILGKTEMYVYDVDTQSEYPSTPETMAKIMGEIAKHVGQGDTANSLLAINSDNSTLIIILVSAVSLIAVASFFMLKKKKESK